MSYTIRRMREEDIPQVVEIEKIAFSRPWTKSVFKAALLLPYAAYYVAVEDAGPEKDALQAGFEKDAAQAGPDQGAAQFLPDMDTARDGLDSGQNAPEKIVGMCGVKKIFEEGDISNVAVHPDYRGRGISRKMLEVLMREAREDGVQAFTLEVRAGNRIAVNLYESLGFCTEGVRPRFYEAPVEDGLIMWLRPQKEKSFYD